MVTAVHAQSQGDGADRSGMTSSSDVRAGTRRPDVRVRPKRGRHRRPLRRKPLWQELLTMLAVALVLSFLIQHVLGRAFATTTVRNSGNRQVDPHRVALAT